MLPLLPVAVSDTLAALPQLEQWLPAGIALLVGLLIGGALFRSGSTARRPERRDRPTRATATLSTSAESSQSIREIAAGQLAANGSHEHEPDQPNGDRKARLAANRRQLANDLATATAAAERQRAEGESARLRIATLESHLGEQGRRLNALTSAAEASLAGRLSPAQRHGAVARTRNLRLAESLRRAREWTGSARDQLGSLRRRLEATEQWLWAASEECAGFRRHLDEQQARGDRRRTEARLRLHHRVAEIDEQIRVYHQHLLGCLKRVGETRDRLEPEHKRLRQASHEIDRAEHQIAALAANAEPDADSVAAILQPRLDAASEQLDGLDALAIERSGDLLRRCDWVATEAPRGLRDAVFRLGESQGNDDLGVAMMLSRTWRKLSDVGERLDQLKAVAEAGRVGQYPDGASPTALIAQAGKVREALAGEPEPAPADEGTQVIAGQAEDLLHDDRDQQIAELEMRCRHLEAKLAKARAKAKASAQTAAASATARGRSPIAPLPSSAPPGPGRGVSIRPLRPGDFARSLVGLESDVSAPPSAETFGDLRQAAPSFEAAQAALACLKPKGHTGPSPGLSADRKRVGKTSGSAPVATPSAAKSSPIPAPAPARQDLKRLEAASEDLLNAVARKQKTPAPTPKPKPSGGGADSAVLFCGNDPRLWNRTRYTGARQRALSLDDLDFDPRFLRLRRLDTGESVLIEVDPADLRPGSLNDHDLRERGFHVGRDSYYGARHLGIFDASLPTEVETRFTYGGWGFGHGISADGSERQFSGWAGLAIDPDTVFEIRVFRDRPTALDGEIFLERRA